MKTSYIQQNIKTLHAYECTYIGLHKKTQCRRCYYHAHVMLKDAIKMPSLHLTYYAS